MNPDMLPDEEIEGILRDRLEPRAPGWENNRVILEAILLKDRKKVARTRRKNLFRYTWIASLGMVAALALSFVFLYQVQQQGGASGDANPVEIVPVQMNPATASAVESAVQSYRAVSARNELVGVEDLGWREREDGTLVREVQYDYVDTVDLLDEEDGTMIRMQVPRQEIVNVAYQVI